MNLVWSLFRPRAIARQKLEYVTRWVALEPCLPTSLGTSWFTASAEAIVSVPSPLNQSLWPGSTHNETELDRPGI